MDTSRLYYGRNLDTEAQLLGLEYRPDLESYRDVEGMAQRGYGYYGSAAASAAKRGYGYYGSAAASDAKRGFYGKNGYGGDAKRGYYGRNVDAERLYYGR